MCVLSNALRDIRRARPGHHHVVPSSPPLCIFVYALLVLIFTLCIQPHLWSAVSGLLSTSGWPDTYPLAWIASSRAWRLPPRRRMFRTTTGRGTRLLKRHSLHNKASRLRIRSSASSGGGLNVGGGFPPPQPPERREQSLMSIRKARVKGLKQMEDIGFTSLHMQCAATPPGTFPFLPTQDYEHQLLYRHEDYDLRRFLPFWRMLERAPIPVGN